MSNIMLTKLAKTGMHTHCRKIHNT